MDEIFTHELEASPLGKDDLRYLNQTEWLVTNGLGGYASGTIGGHSDPCLSRLSDRRAALASRPDYDAERYLRAVVFPDGRTIPLNGVQTEKEPYPEARPT